MKIETDQVEIVGGPSSRRKTVQVLGISAQKVVLKLLPRR